MSTVQNVRCHSRRGFLAGSGAATLAVLANGSVAICHEAAPQAGSVAITAWVRIAADDSVTIKVPATEMGQGVMTALPLILAEELDARLVELLLRERGADRAQCFRFVDRPIHRGETIQGSSFVSLGLLHRPRCG